jgi:hypothetical protein
MTEQTTIQLDRRHKVHRDGDDWVVQRLLSDGSYDMVDKWTGPLRSLYRWCERNKVHPDRDAEATLARQPERTKFIEHS